jgi:hypothetical protein
MIVGIDHIALSCVDIVKASEELALSGFNIKFIEKDVPNFSGKNIFLERYEQTHSIAYCESENGINIELTQHGLTPGESSSLYNLLFSSVPHDSLKKVTPDHELGEYWIRSGLFRPPLQSLWPAFGTNIWHSESSDSEPFSIKGLLVPVSKLSESEALWTRGLNFKVLNRGSIESGKRYIALKYGSPLKTWTLNVLLVESEVFAYQLDSRGFSCLAFLSSNLERDLEKLTSLGATENTGIFFIDVNGRTLKVVVLRGPNKELIELIELK